MQHSLRWALTSALVVLLAGAAVADDNEYRKKIEAETGVPEGNVRALDCSGAIDIACGQPVNGSNVGAPNNVNAYSCVSWNESGGEVVYRLTVPYYGIITATLSGMSADLDLFLLRSCDASSCLSYGDATLTSPSITPGIYYVVVDGYQGASGVFTLSVTCTMCMPTANDICDLAIDLCGPGGGNGPFNRNYSTLCAFNDYNLGSGNACTGFPTPGLDLVYKVCLLPGGSIEATQTGTIDLALYLATDCSNVGVSCVAGSDVCCTGASEHIAYTSPSGGTYYLIVDAYTYLGQTSGTLYGTVTGCCTTAAEEGSWGSVKELFR